MNTVLIISEDYLINSDTAVCDLSTISLSIGNNADVTTNTVCLTGVTDGGWWTCSGTGSYFGIFSNTNFKFPEIMIYS